MAQTAQTVGKGGYEVSIDPAVNGVFGVLIPAPALHVAFRYGVTDRVDIGARVGTHVAEFQSKFLLTEPSNVDLAVSLVPTAGVSYITGAAAIDAVNIFVPLLIGFKLDADEFTIGPRLQNSIYVHGGHYVLSPGVSLGYAAQVADKLRMLPELSIWTPVVATSVDSEYSRFSTGTFFFTATLGFQIGPRRKTVAKKETE